MHEKVRNQAPVQSLRVRGKRGEYVSNTVDGFTVVKSEVIHEVVSLIWRDKIQHQHEEKNQHKYNGQCPLR